MTFNVEVFENEFLAENASTVHAIVKVSSTGGRKLTPTADKAVVLVVDTSSSMESPRTKILNARRGAATAIQLLPDGTLFALVSGSHVARCVYPGSGGRLARASAQTRAEAAALANKLEPDGGTAMSTWIDEVRRLVERNAGAIRLAYLLTDGKNESEKRADNLDRALARAAGVFQCDTRGVGPDWMVRELDRISSALLGEVSRIEDPAEVVDDFRDFMNRAIGKTIADVRLRVWTPKGSTIDHLAQVAPTIEDMTTKGEFQAPSSWEYSTGAWSGLETRDYHLCVDVPPGEVGKEKLAARVSLVVGDDVVGEGLMKAVWTDDVELSTRINREVAHYTRQVELKEKVDEAFEALDARDEDTATAKFRRVVELAQLAGRDDVLEAVANYVELDPDGTVRMRREVLNDDKNATVTTSKKTKRFTRQPPDGEPLTEVAVR